MKKSKGKKRAAKYDTKLAIKGSFEDVINVAVRDIKKPKKKGK